MKKWRLQKTTQCAKCPWKKDVNPHDIPNGYTVKRHRNLAQTISDEVFDPDSLSKPLKIMACHESGKDQFHCVGWLHNQLCNNNIPLRIRMLSCENAKEITIVGEQHEFFEDTLPEMKQNGTQHQID